MKRLTIGRIPLILGTLVVVAVLGPHGAAPAQEATQETAIPGALATDPPDPSGSAPLSVTSIITNSPTRIDRLTAATADLDALKAHPALADRDLSDIQIVGTLTPSINTGQGRAVDIEWGTVARKSDPLEKRVIADPLTTNLIIGSETTQIPKDQPLRANGATEGVVKAVLSLLDDGPAVEAAAAVPAIETEETSSQTAPTATGTSTGSTDTTAFETPEAIVETEGEEDQPIYSSTTEGCAPRVDEAQDVVIMQEQTVIDGVAQGDCGDTLDRMPIQADYEVCATADILDMDAMTATATYRRYYVTPQLVTTYLDTECVADTGAVFDIVEDGNVCGWRFDADKTTATKLVKLTYSNRNNQRVEVTSCQASNDIAPIDTILNIEACDMRHDFNADMSYQRGRVEWVHNGELETDGLCDETGVTYAHYEEEAGCVWEYNLETGEAYPTSRTAILVEDAPVLLDQICAPMASATVSLQATDSGCVGTFIDNFEDQVSYATERFFYTNTSTNQNVYVTSCVMNEGLYYDHLTRIGSYLNNDDTREATPLTEIYIVTPDGEAIRSPAQIREGAVPVPYEYQGTETVEQAAVYRDGGCEKSIPTVLAELYLRPDGTRYEIVIGPGETIGPLDACTSVAQTPVWRPTSDGSIGYVSSYCVSYQTASNEGGRSQVCGAWNANCRITAQYEGTRVLNREDGQTVTQTSANQPSASTSFTTGAINGMGIMSNGDNGNCAATGKSAPDPWTGPDQTQWNQAEGW